MRHRLGALAICTVLMGALGGTSAADAATPYVPPSPETVVARIPSAVADKRAWRQGLTGDVAQARADALAHIEYGRRSGDARHFGYALGILRQGRADRDLPDRLRVPMAMAQQALHQFDAALDTLQEHLRRRPDDTQAWLMRAVIQQVQGDYGAARGSCERVLGRASTLLVVTCVAGAERYTANAAAAFRALHSALQEATAADDSVLGWSLLVLAELAEINADDSVAEQALRAAVTRGGDDVRPLTTYADWLLRRGDTQALLTLVTPDNPSPALRLRRLLALHQQGERADQAQLAWLRQHFAAGDRRAHPLHERDAAIASLHLFAEPHRALDLAVSNWRKQREFADSEILLQAALATSDTRSIRAQLTWLDETRLVDPRLDALRRALTEEGHDDAA